MSHVQRRNLLLVISGFIIAFALSLVIFVALKIVKTDQIVAIVSAVGVFAAGVLGAMKVLKDLFDIDWTKLFVSSADFVRGAVTPPNNLRIIEGVDLRLTEIPMSGRTEELKQIIDLLHDKPVAILGVGGLGKSRLAAEIAQTDEEIEGAVWHVASDISRADEITDILRAHFDLPATTEPHDVFKKLQQTPTLVVIDNAESVEEGDRRKAYIDEITKLANNKAQVLITGRTVWEKLPLVHNHHLEPLSLEDAQKIVLDMAQVWKTIDLTTHAEALAKAARQHPGLIEWAVRKTLKFPDPDRVIRELTELTSTSPLR